MHGHWIIVLLVCVVTASGCADVTQAQTTQPSASPREVVAKALERRAAYWPEGELEAFLDRIEATLAEKGRTLDQQTAADIVQGMKLVEPFNNMQAVAHPLLIRRYQEQVLHELRNYLVLGPLDPEAVKVPLAQLMELLDWAEAELLNAHPQRAEEIRDAIRLRRESLARDARNPFCASLRRPIEPQVIEEAKQEWARDFAEMQDGNINFAITSGYVTALNGSFAPRLPGTESYRAADDAVIENAEQIKTWQAQELDKQRAAQWRTGQPDERKH